MRDRRGRAPGGEPIAGNRILEDDAMDRAEFRDGEGRTRNQTNFCDERTQHPPEATYTKR